MYLTSICALAVCGPTVLLMVTSLSLSPLYKRHYEAVAGTYVVVRDGEGAREKYVQASRGMEYGTDVLGHPWAPRPSLCMRHCNDRERRTTGVKMCHLNFCDSRETNQLHTYQPNG